MTEVSIDDKDLEALLFASGAVNSASVDVRKALKRNPQFEEVEPRLMDAIKRAGDAWRKAGRAVQYPERFVEPTPTELGYLRHLDDRGAGRYNGIPEANALGTPRNLVSNGFVDIAAYETLFQWVGAGPKTYKPQERMVRLTQRGVSYVEESREKERQEAMARLILDDRHRRAAARLAKRNRGWWRIVMRRLQTF